VRAGKWTVLRIGHVNTGMKNVSPPPEGAGGKFYVDKVFIQNRKIQDVD
jgi:hypothetical protein